MALTQITYNDKTDYQSSSLANEYKVSASDMNEIKGVVNGVCTQVDKTNTIVVDTKTTATGVISTATPQTIYSTTLNKGTYLNINNVLINFYGQAGRDMIVAIYVDNVEKTRVNAVLNTNAFTVPVALNYSFEVTDDSTPFRIDVWSSVSGKNYVVNSSLVQILQLK